ncbi:MAG: ATP-binding protein [Bdellovibrionales bacterium]|nr:ATP-binding protein [Bdellovibrionales bacterium]
MERTAYLREIEASFLDHPVVALLGPRQSGKSTLARAYARSCRKEVHFFDLEDPVHLARLESPKLALEDLRGLIVIDEIQRRPDLFPVLRVLADRRKCRFLVLGSASRQLVRQSSETLAGRIAYREVRPFSVRESVDTRKLWMRGGFPRSYLAKSGAAAGSWLKHYVSTFLEQDIPQLGFNMPAGTLRKFWMMLAHYHGGIFHASEIASSLGFSGQTARRYLDILTGTFMIRELQPWHANVDKRQIKSTKIYFRDSGVLHYLLGLDEPSSIMTHPKLGASWEGFALEQVTSHLDLDAEEVFFWGTHAQAEIDMLTIRKGRAIGFEFKYTDAPRVTKSMRIAQKDLDLSALYVVYPGSENFRLDSGITAVGFENLRKFSI